MNLRLIKNSANRGRCRLLDNDKILEWELTPSKYAGINQIKYYIYDVNSNVKREILPKIYKLDLFRFVDVSDNPANVYMVQYNAREQKIHILKYDSSTGKGGILYTFEDDIEEYQEEKKKSVFVMNESNIILQTERLRRNLSDNYEGYFDFELQLYNTKEDKLYDVVDENLIHNGITDMLHIDGNMCVVKLGYSLLEDDRYSILDKMEVAVESVNIVNVQQLISDIIIGQTGIVMDNIDQAYYKQTIPYVVTDDKYIIYSKVDNETKEETINFYNTETKAVITCINKGVTSTNRMAKPLVINGRPHIRIDKKKKTDFLNLKSKKVELSFATDQTVEDVRNDLFIITESKKGMFGKIKKITCVYKYPSMVILHGERGEYAGSLYKDDILYMFLK